MYFLVLFGFLFPDFKIPFETRTKIAIIDTGISITSETKPYLCAEKYDLTGTGIEDNHGHGTNIAGIIAKQIDPKQKCLLIIKYYNTNGALIINVIKAFEIAMKQNAEIINFSSNGKGFYKPEKDMLEKVLQNHINVVVAAGNQGVNLEKGCDYFPPCYNFNDRYFYVIGNGTSEKERFYSSNYGQFVTDWRNGKNIEGFGIYMTGSSQSTAVFSGELAGKK